MWSVIEGDCLESLRSLDSGSIACCVTSPPYWMQRDYGHTGQLGMEPTPQEFVAALRLVFGEVWRVLSPTGSLWLNLGDTYHGGGSTTATGNDNRLYADKRTIQGSYTEGMSNRPVKPRNYAGYREKDLVGIPWRVAFALQDDGWYLRRDIIWHKPNPMPSAATDRATTAHEYVFHMTKSPKYLYNQDAVRERAADGYRNRRSVWTIPTHSSTDGHPAPMPPALAEVCILAGSNSSDTVLDPFCGSGTTGVVAVGLGRRFIGCELNHNDAALSRQRIAAAVPTQQRLFAP